MKWKSMVGAVVILSIIIYIYNYIQISMLYINKVRIDTRKMNKNLKIIQISDYHNNKYINKDKLLKEIKSFNPDIIVLTGDIIDYKTIDTRPVLELLENIIGINEKIYFVSGNHEERNIAGEEFLRNIKEIGIKILDNDKITVDINGEKINLLGLSFFATRDDYSSVVKDIDSKNYTILLSHSPNRPISFISGKEDLILSGHTHGGQVRLPIIGGLLAPGQGVNPEYDKGIYEIGSALLHIDSGLGNSLLPIRLFNRVQITNITIEPKK